MNSSNKTLWLGNIEPWMDNYYLINLLQEIGIYPTKITIKSKPSKRGCAFLEFSTYEIAKKVLNKYNGKIYKNIHIELNLVRGKDKINIIKPVKFTVYFNFFSYLIFIFSYLLEILIKLFQMMN
jgi:RNA recognition motif-containing protein